MAEEDNYTAANMPPSFNEFDYSSTQHIINPLITTTTTAAAVDGSSINNSRIMVDYMLNDCQHPPPPPPQYSQYYLLSHRQSFQHDDDDNHDRDNNNHRHSGDTGPYTNNSFADVMQFADFGPRLALTHNEEEHQHNHNHNHAVDPNNSVNYFLKFPVLNHHHHHQADNEYDPLISTTAAGLHQEERFMTVDAGDGAYDHYQTCYANTSTTTAADQQNTDDQDNTITASAARTALSDHQPVVQLDFLAQTSNNNNNNNTNTTSCSNNNNNNISMVNAAVEALQNSSNVVVGSNGKTGNNNNSNKRKRPRTLKTTEEVESQRMTHIAVERNRRKQMNEHLRVLRTLMPSSYVQRGDQASIIGGAIEFVRELEQLLQCLESQKRRRLYGDSGGASAVLPIDPTSSSQQPPPPQQLNVDPTSLIIDVGGDDDHQQALQQQLDGGGAVAVMLQGGGGIREEVAENKSCVADVEVKLLGFDALIKILSRRRPGQLIRAISALQEDLQFSILHTNITTIEQTVLYSFNVKITSEQRFTADDIATSVQQIFTFIHANSSCNNSM